MVGRGRAAAVFLSAALAVTLLSGGCSRESGGRRVLRAQGTEPATSQNGLSDRDAKGVPEDGGTLIRAIPVDPVTLNPVIASDQGSYDVYKWIFDPLIDMDRSMHPVGVLAESWETSADGLTTVFHLRRNVTWQDGVPFTADDVLFTYRAAMDPNVDALGQRPAFAKVAGVEKTGTYTVVVHWKEPYAPGLASWVFYIMPRHVYDYPKGKGTFFNRNPRNAEPVGTGPYKLSEWDRGKKVVLVANDHYFGGRPHIDELVFKIIPERQTRLAAFETHQLDVVDLSADMLKRLKRDPQFERSARIFEYGVRQFLYLGWNMDGSNPFFTDRRVRRAMTLAIDRRGIVDKLLDGHGTLGSSPIYPDSWAKNPGVKPLPYDPARSAVLLDRAGWRDTDGDGVRDKNGRPFSFECLVPAEAPRYVRFLQIVQQDLGKVGVTMSIRKLEWSVFLDRTERHKYQASLSGWGLGDDPDPYQLLASPQSRLLPSGVGAGQNDMSYHSGTADALMEAEERTTDPEKRRKIFWELDKVVSADQPVTILFWVNKITAVRSRFLGARVSRSGYGLFGWYPSSLEWWVPRKMQRIR